MGDVVPLDGYTDQIGVSLNGYTLGLNIEENHFFTDGWIADNTLGIVVRNLGEMDNIIRRDTFENMTVGNEAFDRNGMRYDEFDRGLVYLCNTNANVGLNDFFIPDHDTIDVISGTQSWYNRQTYKATGNVFSSTGDAASDFNNRGDLGIKYVYFNLSNQYPDEEFGLTDTIIGIQNPCEPTYCLHPCLISEDFEDQADAFYITHADFESALSHHDTLMATFDRWLLDSNLVGLVRYLELDTTDFDRDTLRAWYGRSESISGDLLLAGDYYDEGEYVNMWDVLDAIPVRYSLATDQVMDLVRLDTIYSIITTGSITSLSSTEMDTLMLYADGYGSSSALARSILSQLDTFFTPRYYIPGDILPRSVKSPDTTVIKIPVYPNPAENTLFIDLPSRYGDEVLLKFYNILGSIIFTWPLHASHNQIELGFQSHIPPGLMVYTISRNNQIISYGKLIIE
jgi:hypothetical protein